MVLFVEGELTAAIGAFRCYRRGCPRATAQMNHLRGGTEQNASLSGANRGAEVDVFRVHEEPIVHQPDGFSICTPDEETRAADPVDLPRFACHRLQVGGEWSGSFAALHEKFLSELHERRQHSAEGKLYASVHIDQTWARDRRIGSRVQLRDECVDCPGRTDVSGLSRRISEPNVC